MARLTGLEPATPGVTGRYSNQLSYNRSLPLVDPSVFVLLCPVPCPVKRFSNRFALLEKFVPNNTFTNAA